MRTRFTGGRLVGEIPLQLVGDDADGADIDQRLTRARLWLWRLFVDQMIRATTSMNANRFHAVIASLQVYFAGSCSSQALAKSAISSQPSCEVSRCARPGNSWKATCAVERL